MPNYSIILITYENLDFDDLDLAFQCFAELSNARCLILNEGKGILLESKHGN